jgi:hypothetical protein
MQMEKLPYLAVIHKRVNTVNMRSSQMEGQLASNPLACNLGLFDFGKYTTAVEDKNSAFVEINEMHGPNALRCNWTQKIKTAKTKVTRKKNHLMELS